MKSLFLALIILVVAGNSSSQAPASINADGLADLLAPENDTLYIINFWATWCSPCVREIGYFEELHRASGNSAQKVILVNLDFPNQLEKRVLPFIEEKNLTADIYHMTEMDYNSWIPLVDPEWSGAIPATLFLKADKREFISRELSQNELISVISNFK